MPLHVAMEAKVKIAEVVNVSLQRSYMNLNTSAWWSTSECSTRAPSTPFNTDSNSEDVNITDCILLQNVIQNN